MAHYFKRVWAMITPFREETAPLLPDKASDLEACAYGSAAGSDSIVLVCEAPEDPEAPAPSHHVRVSPFSEDHFPPWPLLSSDS